MGRAPRSIASIAAAALLATVTGASTATSAGADAGDFSLVHSFAVPEGSSGAPLVKGTDGSLYGITQAGGDFSVRPPDGGGTVFRVDGAGNFTLLHVFKGTDGSIPTSLIQGRDGFFYGTTRYGGSGYRADEPIFYPGTGTIFRMDSAGNVTTLRDFPGGADWLADGVHPGPSCRVRTARSTGARPEAS